MKKSLADYRLHYDKGVLLESDVPASPFRLFEQFLADAINTEEEIEPNAFTLATTDEQGYPNARVLLLKGFDQKGFVYYTNYNSRKGRELMHNPNVCMVFWWRTLQRQVRVRGKIKRVEASLSDHYFQSRPIGSQAGAAASPQSQVIPNRDQIELDYKNIMSAAEHKNINRPAHWGGYRVIPHYFEFWQGRANRLHDRLRYVKQFDQSWLLERLAP